MVGETVSVARLEPGPPRREQALTQTAIEDSTFDLADPLAVELHLDVDTSIHREATKHLQDGLDVLEHLGIRRATRNEENAACSANGLVVRAGAGALVGLVDELRRRDDPCARDCQPFHGAADLLDLAVRERRYESEEEWLLVVSCHRVVVMATARSLSVAARS